MRYVNNASVFSWADWQSSPKQESVVEKASSQDREEDQGLIAEPVVNPANNLVEIDEDLVEIDLGAPLAPFLPNELNKSPVERLYPVRSPLASPIDENGHDRIVSPKVSHLYDSIAAPVFAVDAEPSAPVIGMRRNNRYSNLTAIGNIQQQSPSHHPKSPFAIIPKADSVDDASSSSSHSSQLSAGLQLKRVKSIEEELFKFEF